MKVLSEIIDLKRAQNFPPMKVLIKYQVLNG